MIKTIPFTYLIKQIPTNKYYYGVRFKKNCNPNDLWTKYFTSSKKVKSLIKKYGKKSFIFEIRKVFKTAQEAIKWESKVLKRMKVIYRKDFLNLTDNKSIDPIYLSKIMMGKRKGKNNYMFGKKHSKETIKKMRLASLGKKNPMYGKQRTEEVKQKLRLSNLGKKNPMYGKKHTKESIKKLKLIKISYWKKIKENKIDLTQKSL